MLRDRQNDLLKVCRDFKVLKQTKYTGRHYLTSSGAHTDEFFEFATGFAHADFRRVIGTEFMEDLGKLGLLENIGVIVTPAIGGILLAGTMQHLFYGKQPLLIYAEKDRDGFYSFRRNFQLPQNEGILLLDDAYSSGATMKSLMRLCEAEEDAGPIVANCAIVNRNPQGFPLPEHAISIPNIFLIRYPIATYWPIHCPYDTRGVPLEKDGVLVDVFGSPIALKRE